MNIILIPYRNREEHLKYFIENSYPILKKILKELQIIIIEQTCDKLFNRGKLLNVGFTLYKIKGTNFFTHDVDINPTIETIEKYYTKNVKDNEIMGIYTSACNTLGGIIKFQEKEYLKTNGFPNEIWGWGTEDKALQNRAEFKDIKISKNILNNDPKKDQIFKIFDNVDDRIKVNMNKNWFSHYRLFEKLSNDEREKQIMSDGLNNLTFEIKNIEEINKDIKKITVEI